MQDGCLQYLGNGDLFFSTMQNHSTGIELPLGYYKGVAVIIEPDTANTAIKNWLPDSHIDIHQLMKRLLAADECLMIDSNPAFMRILENADSVPADMRPDLYRLKVLEMLLCLNQFDPSVEKPKTIFMKQQVEIVKQIHKKLIKQPGQRFTIEELAQEYCISPTTLKVNFKGVYGSSIAAYMKTYRINLAAGLLRNTSYTIAEIAADMGYESHSKFGAAFKSVMKMTPMEYRKSRIMAADNSKNPRNSFK